MNSLKKMFPNAEQKFFRAVDDGDIDAVRIILKSHPQAVHWNSFPDYQATALMWASAAGRQEIAGLLLDHGANIKARDAAGRTPFHYLVDGMLQGAGTLHPNPAVKFDPTDHKATAMLLLQRGADPDTKDAYGRTPLSRTIWGFDRVAQFLIDIGADVEARDDQGHTLLMRAAAGKSEKIVRLLLDNGASALAATRDGKNTLDLALESDMFTDVPSKHEKTIAMLRGAVEVQQKRAAGLRPSYPKRPPRHP